MTAPKIRTTTPRVSFQIVGMQNQQNRKLFRPSQQLDSSTAHDQPSIRVTVVNYVSTILCCWNVGWLSDYKFWVVSMCPADGLVCLIDEWVKLGWVSSKGGRFKRGVSSFVYVTLTFKKSIIISDFLSSLPAVRVWQIDDGF